jgi:hypothetical protein
MSREITRRRFLKKSVLASTSAALGLSSPRSGLLASATNQPTEESTAEARQPFPTGKLGNLKISRVIAGGNLISGWCHARDLLFVRGLAEAYLTEKKQFDTLELLEDRGVNAIMIDMMQMDITDRYCRERGGQIQTIIGVRQDWGAWGKPDWDDLKRDIDRTIDRGVNTMFMHGGYCDRLVEAGKTENIELLGKAIEYIKKQGFPAGLGSHSLHVPIECDKLGVTPDYYVKTFHHDQYWSATPKGRRKKFCVDGPLHLDHNEFHDNIFCISPAETIEFMKKKRQPWIAFKTLAGGAIHPKSGFKYAFENGADFIAVGMFDFEVVEDTIIARNVLEETENRERPWRA